MAKNAELPGVDGPGVGPVVHKDVDDGFDTLLGARSNRMRWGIKEKEAQAELIALFKKRGLSKYVYDDKVYVLADIEKIKLQPKDEESNGE